jgi:hypothetical protein
LDFLFVSSFENHDTAFVLLFVQALMPGGHFLSSLMKKVNKEIKPELSLLPANATAPPEFWQACPLSILRIELG